MRIVNEAISRVFIVSALLCLCVSDSVGPRLLPLPNLAFVATNAKQTKIAASQSPSHNHEHSPHMEMWVGSQYRSRDRHDHPQQAAEISGTFLLYPILHSVAVLSNFESFKVELPFLETAPGRAPPQIL